MAAEKRADKGRTGNYQPPFVLSIDVGSSAIKTALYDAECLVVPGTEVRIGHELRTTPDGGSEEVAGDLAERVERSVDKVIVQAGRLVEKIGAVGLDTMASTILGLDDDGSPVTPVFTYADTRPRDYVERLKKELDVLDVHNRTGCPQHTSYQPARLL